MNHKVSDFPSKKSYLSVWPAYGAIVSNVEDDQRDVYDRKKLIGYIDSVRDGSLLEVNFDPYWAGYWMLSELERRACMGLFFQHIRDNGPASIFSEQVVNSLELPPQFDINFEKFLSEKSIYRNEEKVLICEMMSYMYQFAYSADEWRYKEQTLAYWCS